MSEEIEETRATQAKLDEIFNEFIQNSKGIGVEIKIVFWLDVEADRMNYSSAAIPRHEAITHLKKALGLLEEREANSPRETVPLSEG